MADLEKPAPELMGEIATTRDGRDITRPWVAELEQPLDRQLWGVVDWGPYDRILLDDQVKSCMEQRIRAVVSREWNVLSGQEGDPRADAAGKALKDALDRIGWDRVTEKMLYAVLFGCSVAELMWDTGPPSFDWAQVKVRHARRFRYDRDGKLRLLTTARPQGEIVPDRKFWVVTSGGTDDDNPYGRGLAEWLYWPVLFKRNGVRFWNIFLDKFSVPTAMATYPRGASKADIDKALEAVQAIASDTGIVVPEGFAIELLQLAQNGVNFGDVCKYMDGAIAKIILSQTMTTDNGSSRSQAEVHDGVKLEVIKADADLLTDSFAAGPARWFTDFNFGIDVAAPRVIRIVEQEQNLKLEAEKDLVLNEMGFELDDEAFADRYGEGYRRKPRPVPAVSAAHPSAKAANEPDQASANVVPIKVASFAADDPRPLYVYRQVRNADEIMLWAKEQGFTSVLPAHDMHVTIIYSRKPVNWFAMASEFVLGDRMVIEPGGPRVVDRLGDQGAVVLHFVGEPLMWRNRQMRDAGASWDYPQFLPHITLTYQPGGLDLTKVRPYTGRIVLGPEMFETIEQDWEAQVSEINLAENSVDPLQPRDQIDEAIDAIMADEGWRPLLAPIVEPLVEALTRATTIEDVRAILAREAELDSDAALDQGLSRAGFALRIDALTDDAGDTGTDA